MRMHRYPSLLRDLLHELVLEIGELEARVQTVEKHLEALSRQTPVIERLRTIPGVGLLTATALVGFVGDVARFPSGRHFACYLGLTPREHSSGGRRSLGRISKRGDAYLRMLLIHGARAVLWGARSKTEPDRLRSWALDLQQRRGHNKGCNWRRQQDGPYHLGRLEIWNTVRVPSSACWLRGSKSETSFPQLHDFGSN
jgi:transposase